MTEVIIAVVSVLLGAGFDRALGVYFEGRSEKEQLSRVRTLLALEIDRNLSEVRRIWEDVTSLDEGQVSQPSDAERIRLSAARLITLPFPHWTRTAWEGHAASIPAALTTPQITRIHELYTRLDALVGLREALDRLDQGDRERMSRLSATSGGTIPMIMANGRFHSLAPQLWAQYEKTTADVLNAGNILEFALDTPKNRSLPSPRN